MKIQQKKFSEVEGWKALGGEDLGQTAQLVLVFGGRSLLEDKKYFDELNVGDSLVTARRTVTEADIVNFAGISGDFFYAHMDDIAARDSISTPSSRAAARIDVPSSTCPRRPEGWRMTVCFLIMGFLCN